MPYIQSHLRQSAFFSGQSDEHQTWWKQRRSYPTRKYYEALGNQHELISIPLPSFPPALDFDPAKFITSYDQAEDLEKATLCDMQSVTTMDSSTPTESYGVDCKEPFALEKSECSYGTRIELHLPPKRHLRPLRHLRFTFFAVYQRLFSFIFVINICGALALLHRYAETQNLELDTLATFASTNFLLAILIRQDFVINLLYRTAWLVPWTVPLAIRRLVARVYCYGGIHSGAAVAGTVWWATFTTMMTLEFARQNHYTVPIMVLTWLILTSLCITILLACPKIRARHHNTFELTHRFLGWSSVGLFWAQIFLLTYHTAKSLPNQSYAKLVTHSPTFWNLILITTLLVYPWIRLRPWTFIANPLSLHALRLSFSEPVHKFSCLSISSSPLKEWHPFATFPSTDSTQSGGSMVVSDAGDWTRGVIQNALYAKKIGGDVEVTMKFWVKGSVKAGMLSLSCIFRRVVILTTGSGIGPALSSLIDKPAGQLTRLIWSTRSPLATYGLELCEGVEKADPDALVIDTTQMGRPDLVTVAYRIWKEMDAEAVFVLSNETVTRKVIYGLESRGVLAFGPIWDS